MLNVSTKKIMKNFFFLKLLSLTIAGTFGALGSSSTFTPKRHQNLPPRFSLPYYGYSQPYPPYYVPSQQNYVPSQQNPQNFEGIDLYNEDNEVLFLELIISGLKEQIQAMNEHYGKVDAFFKKSGGAFAYYESAKERDARHKANLLEYQLEIGEYEKAFKTLKEKLKDIQLPEEVNLLLTAQTWEKKTPPKDPLTRDQLTLLCQELRDVIQELTESRHKIQFLESSMKKNEDFFLSQIIASTDQITSLSGKLEQLNTQAELLKKTIKDLEEYKDAINRKNKVYKKEIKNLIKGVKGKNRKISSLTTKHKNEIQTLLGEQKQKEAEWQTLQSTLETITNNANAKTEKLQEKLTTKNKEKQDLYQKSESANAEIEKLKENIVIDTTKIKELNSIIETQNREIDQLSKQPSNPDPKIKEENSQLKKNIEELQKTIDNLLAKSSAQEDESQKRTKLDQQTIWTMKDRIVAQETYMIKQNKAITKLVSDRDTLVKRAGDLQSKAKEWEKTCDDLREAVFALVAEKEKNEKLIAGLGSELETLRLEKKLQSKNQNLQANDISKTEKKGPESKSKDEEENKKLKKCLADSLEQEKVLRARIKELEKKLAESESVRKSQRNALLDELGDLTKDPTVKKIAPSGLIKIAQDVFSTASKLSSTTEKKTKK